MVYQWMKSYRHVYGVGEMAKVLQISRSGYYRYQQGKLSMRQQTDNRLLLSIKQIHQASHGLYGSVRIHHQLRHDGMQVGRKRVIRLMQQVGIRAKHVKRYKVTTRVDARLPVVPNQLQQQFTANQPNEKWVGDITYCATQTGWLYLATVIDLFSRKVVGWAMATHMTKQLVIDAFTQAVMHRRKTTGLLFHSDKGSQYTSYAFQQLLKQHGVTASMSGKGNCFDNAVAESFFHSLKTEWIYQQRYENPDQAKKSIFQYIELFYNNQRLHSHCGYLSPNEFEKQFEASCESVP